jgi:transcriptional regulator with XRE-family HTH domain
MIEEIYEKNIQKLKHDLQKTDFPTTIRLCREMMGLKQFAAAEYLGLERHRYKKIECGDMPRGAYEEEIRRLAIFYHLDEEWLVKKHKAFLENMKSERKEVSRNVWDTIKSARGFGKEG